MSITEIRDQSSTTSREIHDRLIILESLMNEFINKGATLTLSPAMKEDYFMRIGDLEASIKMIRCMVIDFEGDVWAACNRSLIV